MSEGLHRLARLHKPHHFIGAASVLAMGILLYSSMLGQFARAATTAGSPVQLAVGTSTNCIDGGSCSTPVSYSLTVTKAGTGSGTITSSLGGINCGSTCSASYLSGSTVTLTAAPSTSATFASWSSNCLAGDGVTAPKTVCTVTMNQAKTVTATFTASPTVYTLSVNRAGTGSGSVVSSPISNQSTITCDDASHNCTASFFSGTTVTLIATPSTGATFAGWSDNCVPTPAASSCTITLNQQTVNPLTLWATVTATFNSNPSYTLTVVTQGTGAGSITSSPSGINCGNGLWQQCGASFTSGTNVLLTAAPLNGATVNWSSNCQAGDGVTAPKTVCTTIMDAAKTVTATFSTNSTTVLNPGDVVKLADQPMIYYIGGDNRRYVFPYTPDWANWKNVFYSWGLVDSQVKTVTMAQLTALAIGGNVTVRPGTYLVQNLAVNGSAYVYAVSYPNILHLVPTDQLPILYGTNWASRVLTIPDAFWVNYAPGQPVGAGTWPDGSLISYERGVYGTYLVYGGQVKKFATDAAFAVNRYSTNNVLVSTFGTSSPQGTDITGIVPCLTDVAQITPCGFTSGSMFKISEITPFTSPYAPGASISFKVRGIEPDGTWTAADEGFGVGAQVYTASGPYQPVLGSTVQMYDPATGWYSLTVPAPSLAGTYNMRVAINCGFDSGKVCSDRYGSGGPQVEQMVPFAVGSSTSGSIKIITPQGGEQWKKMSNYVVGWSTANIPTQYLALTPEYEFVDEQGNVAYHASYVGSTFAGTSDSRFGNTIVNVSNIHLTSGQKYRIRVIGWNSSNVKVIEGMSAGYVTVVDSITPRSCSSTTSIIDEAALGTSTFANLGLDISTHPEILKYRIQWSGGGWSDWYTPGVDDVDWKADDVTKPRRVWAYFGDHAHEYQKCTGAANSLPDLTAYDYQFTNLIGYDSNWSGRVAFKVKNIGVATPTDGFKITVTNTTLNKVIFDQLYHGPYFEPGSYFAQVYVVGKLGNEFALGKNAITVSVDSGGSIKEAKEDNNVLLGGVMFDSPYRHVRGNVEAPVTLEEWVDYQSPYVVRFGSTIASVLKTYDGKVNLVVRHFPLAFDPLAQKGAEATECATAQNELYFWKFHDWFMAQADSSQWTIDSIKAYANQLGVSPDTVGFDPQAFAKCLDSGEKASVVQSYLSEGQGKGISGVPTTFVIRNSTGLRQKVEGAVPFDTLKAVVDGVLGSSGSTPVGSAVPSLSDITSDAQAVTNGDTAALSTSTDAEQLALQQRAETIIAKIKALQAELATITPQLKDFIALGTPSTQRLGQGERAGVVSSFTSAFGKAPSSENDWQDVLKIANGRWPTQRSEQKEQQAEAAFEKIYKRAANRDTNTHDDAAVTVMAYGLRPSGRNLGSEAAAAKSFTAIYGHAPESASDWDTVRAIAYSGATR